MAKSLFEQLGGTYRKESDYLIPCLTVPAEEEQSIGIWGQRHLNYLKQHQKVTYTNFLTSGNLNTYLAEITSKYIKKWLSVLLTAIFFNILHFQKVHILAFYEKEGICYT